MFFLDLYKFSTLTTTVLLDPESKWWSDTKPYAGPLAPQFKDISYVYIMYMLHWFIPQVRQIKQHTEHLPDWSSVQFFAWEPGKTLTSTKLAQAFLQSVKKTFGPRMAEGCPSRICTMLRPMGAWLTLLFLKRMLRTVICEATEWTLHLLDWNMFVTEADVYTVRQQYYWSNRGGARPGPLVHWSCWRGWKGARKTGQFWWFSCQSIYVFLSEKTSYPLPILLM